MVIFTLGHTPAYSLPAGRQGRQVSHGNYYFQLNTAATIVS